MTREKGQDLTAGTEGRKTIPLNHNKLLDWLNYLLKSHPEERGKAETLSSLLHIIRPGMPPFSVSCKT